MTHPHQPGSSIRNLDLTLDPRFPLDTPAITRGRQDVAKQEKALQAKFKALDTPPPTGSRTFFDWLSDWGAGMNKRATADPRASLLSSIGSGFGAASAGIKTRRADARKMKNMALQNLTAEMGMATFSRGSLKDKTIEQQNLFKLGTARIAAETAYKKAIAEAQPWKRASDEWKVTNEYAPKDVVWLKFGKTPYVGKKAPT